MRLFISFLAGFPGVAMAHLEIKKKEERNYQRRHKNSNISVTFMSVLDYDDVIYVHASAQSLRGL